jgi:hypothetical protein
VLLAIGAVVAVGIVVDLTVGYSPLPGYGSYIGLGGTIVLLVAARWLKRWLARPEGYDSGEAPPEVELDLLGPPRHGPGPRDQRPTGGTGAPARTRPTDGRGGQDG